MAKSSQGAAAASPHYAAAGVPIADAHLDLAYNALRGRDVLKPAMEQTPDGEGTPSVGLPDLRRGGAVLICASIFCEPARAGAGGYNSPDEAHAMALSQLRWYGDRAAEGHLAIVADAASLAAASSLTRAGVVPAVLLLEGADPIRGEEDLVMFSRAGLRVVGLAWRQTRFAGGTGAPGPLTADGRWLVRALDELHMIHDVSHLAEESFWQLLELARGPAMASHSNVRAIAGTDRHLSDVMIRALAARGGVMGINLYDRFLLPHSEHGRRRPTLDDAVRHVRYVCDLLGDCRHVGIGSDMDGGFGAEHLPEGVHNWSDLRRLAESLSRAGFCDADVAAVMSGNWLRFMAASLG